MPSSSHVRMTPPIAPPSPMSQASSISSRDSNFTQSSRKALKARENALLKEIEDVKALGSSIPEDEARATIAQLLRNLESLRKDFPRQNMVKTVEKLKLRLASLENRYKNDTAILKKKLEEAKQALGECETVITEQENLIKKKEKIGDDLRAKIDDITRQMKKMKKIIIEQDKEIEKMEKMEDEKNENDIKQLEELANDQENTIENLTKDVAALKRERDTFNSKLNFVNATKRRLKDSNSELNKQLSAATDIQEDLKKKLEEREKTIATLQEKISSMEDFTAKDLSSDEEDDSNEFDDDIKFQSVDAKVKQLTKLCATFEKRERKSQKITIDEIDKFKLVIEALQKETDRIMTLEKDLEKCQMEFSELQQNHETSQEENAASVRAIQRVMAELSDEKDLEIESLKDKIKSLQSDYESLQEKIQNEMKSYEVEYKPHQEATPTLMGIAASATTSGFTATEDDVDCTIDELEDEIDKLQKENIDLRKTLETLQKQDPNDNSSALNDANAEIEELDREIDLLHEENESLREKVKALKAQAKTEIQDNAKETQIFKEEIEQMDKEINTLKFENESLKQKLLNGKTPENVQQDMSVNLDSHQDDNCDLKSEELKKGRTAQLGAGGDLEPNTEKDAPVEQDQQDTSYTQSISISSNDSCENKSPQDTQPIIIDSDEVEELHKDIQALNTENKYLKEEIEYLQQQINASSKESHVSTTHIVAQDEDNIQNDDQFLDDDDATAEIDNNHLLELNELREALQLSTNREKTLAYEVQKLQYQLKAPENKQLDSLMVSEDESALFALINDGNTARSSFDSEKPIITPTNDCIEISEADDGQRRFHFDTDRDRNDTNFIHSTVKTNTIDLSNENLSSYNDVQSEKTQSEIDELNDGNEQDVHVWEQEKELIDARRKINALQSILDNEQKNSSEEKEAILKVLQTKNEALENAKMIIASLQNARSESLKTLNDTLSQKEEEICSLQNLTDEEKKRSTILQLEIEKYRNHIADNTFMKPDVREEGKNKDLVSAVLNQISFAIQGCTDANDNNVNDNLISYTLTEDTNSVIDDTDIPMDELQRKLAKKSKLIKVFEEEVEYMDTALNESNDRINDLETENMDLIERMDQLGKDKDILINNLVDRIKLTEEDLDEKKSKVIALEKKNLQTLNEGYAEINRLKKESLNAQASMNQMQASIDQLQSLLDVSNSKNVSLKNDLSSTEESLRNAKMIISSLEKSNRRMLDDFKNKLQESAGNLTNIKSHSTEKDAEILKIRNELDELRVMRKKELEWNTSEIQRLNDINSENASKIAELEKEIKRLKSYVKAKRNKSSYNDGSVTDDSRSVISQRSDGKKVRRVKKKDKGKKTSPSKQSDEISNNQNKRSIPPSPPRAQDLSLANVSDTDREMEFFKSNASMLLEEDSDTYDEKQLMEQYMKSNHITTFDRYEV